ncbi:MAG: UDP-N-acetylglucosamine 1-carboxyvinyltransferase [Cellvibrionales bacterium TMED49]|nr:UDP-N-acetylglucosamine 1-carboxyvinyltransferase [Porticoccaceae bacterium]OUU40813.1 MAG: UDP-N-acetylglucosamine 1-carboxyvinyltransferase [Cellvibrionales bacterium TMED49]
MEKIVIQGGTSLMGSLEISGSKNASLPILAAMLLCEGKTTVANLPHLQDVTTSLELLGSLGVELSIDENRYVEADTRTIHSLTTPSELVRKMRASILVLGPMLSRFGEAKVSFPGGCAIGSRPVDLHIAGMESLGAEIVIEDGFIKASRRERLRGATINLPFPSVGATENIIMAASLAEGTTRINNSALEPEIIDLVDCLNAWGANIRGAGKSTIVIEGVQKMNGGFFRVMSDRIETATFLAAAAATGGKIRTRNVDPTNISAVLEKLRKAGGDLTLGADWIELDMRGKRPKAVDFKTGPYPDFPTDMQAQFTVVNSLAIGTAYITETIFENRLMQVQELRRMGAKIALNDNEAVVTGVSKLTGTRVMASDLRASAALVIAGVAAEGETIIEEIHHVDRGYECFEEKLHQLGAKITRTSS